MHLRRPALATLLLFAGVPLAGAPLGTGTADAACIVIGTKLKKDAKRNHYRVVLTGTDEAAAASVALQLKSDAGEEELPLVESDTWLHGGAALAELPASAAELSLTLYDADSAALISYSGRLDADGAVTLVADATETATDASGCTSRLGCGEETREESVDVELLAAEVFPDGDGFVLAIDLAGADAYAVAYGEVRYTPPCDLGAERGICLSEVEPVTAEVDWGDVGTVWEAEATLAHEGVVEVKVEARDARGRKLESEKADLAQPWLDDGAGVTTLGTDEDPRTMLAISPNPRAFGAGKYALDLDNARVTVVSEGWSVDEALPTHAEVELDDGDTLTLPVNSYQRVSKEPKTFAAAYCAREYSWSGFEPLRRDGLRFKDVGASERRIPLCCADACVVLVDNEDGTCGISVTAYSDDARSLPDGIELDVTVTGPKGEKVLSERIHVELGYDVVAVYALDVGFTGDPLGLDLSGEVTLLGEADPEGRQDTLAKGAFYGTFTRDGDGELALGGASGGAGHSDGDVIVGGEAVFLTDRDGAPRPPPAIQYANGSGTKAASSQTSTRPELL